MAVSNTYDANASIREDLANDIRTISPTETPFYSMVKKVAVGNRRNDWLTNLLTAASATNAVIEGADAGTPITRNPARLANSTQLSEKPIEVTSTTRASETAGREDDYNYQMLLSGQELKRDVEAMLTQNNAENQGTTGVARLSAGLESCIYTNTSFDATSGVDGGWDGTTWNAPTDSSADRALTEALAKGVMKDIFVQGGDPGVIMTGPFNKQQVSTTFVGIAVLQRETGASLSPASVMGAIDVYRSDFGVLNVYPNRFQRDKTLFILDMNHWECGVMQDFTEVPLAKTGHSDKGMVTCEKNLRARQEAASGAIRDLTTA